MPRKIHPARRARNLTGAVSAFALVGMVTGFQMAAAAEEAKKAKLEAVPTQVAAVSSEPVSVTEVAPAVEAPAAEAPAPVEEVVIVVEAPAVEAPAPPAPAPEPPAPAAPPSGTTGGS